MIQIGDRTLIGTLENGTRVYGTVTYIHPKNRYVLTERDVPYGNKIRECVMIGQRRGQFANRVIGGWRK